jgi:hypothetical protein
MSRTPALQDLAIYARDHFGENGLPFDDDIPSSFDTVVEVYARSSDEQEARAQSSAVLCERLQTQSADGAVVPEEIDEFVEETVTYLQTQYPEPEQVMDDRLILSHLFWGQLVEARLGREQQPSERFG